MDFSIENDFVKRAIKKDYQERIIFELQSQKHREKAIDRLSHSPEAILKDVFTEYTVNDFSNVLGNINAKEKFYIIGKRYNFVNADLVHTTNFLHNYKMEERFAYLIKTYKQEIINDRLKSLENDFGQI